MSKIKLITGIFPRVLRGVLRFVPKHLAPCHSLNLFDSVQFKERTWNIFIILIKKQR